MKTSGSKASTQLPTLALVLKRAHLGVALTAVILAGIFLTVGGLLVLSRVAEHSVLLLGRSLSYSVEAAVMFRDAEATQEIVSIIASTEEVSFIQVTDRDGNLLAEWSADKGFLERWISYLVMSSEQQLPIYYEEDAIGNLTLIGGGGWFITFLVNGVALIFASLLISVLCAFLLSRRLLQSIIVPLQQLAKVAHQIRHERAFDERLPSAGIAELNELSIDFNELVEELGEWQVRWREENAALSHKVQHDGLTGVASRSYFESQLLRSVHNARLEHNRIAVLFIDCNNFKQINDSLGHACGDAVLIELGVRLRRHVRTNDLVARLGGDEFGVIISPLQRVEDVRSIVEHIQEGMLEPILLPDEKTLILSISIGVAIFPDDADDSDKLLRRADDAMYVAKSQNVSAFKASHNVCRSMDS